MSSQPNLTLTEFTIMQMLVWVEGLGGRKVGLSEITWCQVNPT